MVTFYYILYTFFIFPASQQWSKVHAKGTPPPARAAASLVAVGSKVYLFGGLSHMFGWFDDVFTFDTGTRSHILGHLKEKQNQ